MTLDPSVKVPMPATGVVTYRKGASLPVYKTIRSFRNERGTPGNERVCIGRMDPETGMLIPNASYWSCRGGNRPVLTVLDRSDSIRGVGGSFLVGALMSGLGLAGVLDRVMGEARSGLLRTAATRMVAGDDALEDAADFGDGSTPGERPLPSQAASRLFASITEGERREFFRQWLDKRPPGGDLACDAGDVGDGGFGKDGTGWEAPRLNLGGYVS